MRIGIVGVGFMGMVHYLTYLKLRGAKVVALAERDAAKRRGDWRSIKGNFGPPGERMDLSAVTTYEGIDELLADPSVELVDITLPPSLHADVAVRAMRAGKHVFCEKPMAMTVADCERMRRAAERADRRLLVGHVLPFFPEYAWALAEIRGGKHGRLLGGSFKRVIADPAWLANYWSGSRVGGPLLDLHVHDAHFLRLVFGRPSSVTSAGRTRPDADGGDALPEHWQTQFDFDEAYSVTTVSGTIPQQGRPFQHGFEIHLERATLVFDFAVLGERAEYLCPPTLLDHRGAAKRATLRGGDPMDAFAAELKEVVRAVRTGGDSPALDPETARDAIALCQKQAQSLRTGKRVKV